MAFYAKFRHEHGKPHPHMEQRPRLTPHQLTIWHAFGEIARSRITDQGYRPLNDADVERWCRRKGRSLRYADYLWEQVRGLDDTWLELQGAKRERDAELRRMMDAPASRT
jgi:hypothetical protein